MATTKREFLCGVTFLSFVTVALIATSFATESWVEANLLQNASDTLRSPLNYGLFTGALKRVNTEANQNSLSLTLTCLMSENICAWSCHLLVEDREEELQHLFQDGNLGLEISTMIGRCEGLLATGINLPGNQDQSNKVQIGNKAQIGNKVQIGNTKATETDSSERQFINAGLWVSTILFLTLSMVLATVTSLFSLHNVLSNPVHQLAGVRGLYIWNALAALCNLVVLILWGAQYAATLTDNIAYSEVISGGFISKGNANLGYSYWLVLISLVSHTVNLLLLAVRDFLINREPEPEEPIKMQEDQDGAIFLY